MATSRKPLTPARAMLYVLAAPWYAAWGVARALGLMAAVARRGLRPRWSTIDEVTCAAGHLNPVLGRWQCRCGFEYAGRAFAPCPSCGEEAGWVRCDRCGLGVRSPDNAP